RLGKPQAPILVLEIEHGTDSVAAGVGRVVVAAIAVHGPVQELQVAIAARAVVIEKIHQGKTPNAKFETAGGQRSEKRKRAALGWAAVGAQRKDGVKNSACNVRGRAERRVAHDVKIGVTRQTEGIANALSASAFDVQQ